MVATTGESTSNNEEEEEGDEEDEEEADSSDVEKEYTTLDQYRQELQSNNNSWKQASSVSLNKMLSAPKTILDCCEKYCPELKRMREIFARVKDDASVTLSEADADSFTSGSKQFYSQRVRSIAEKVLEYVFDTKEIEYHGRTQYGPRICTWFCKMTIAEIRLNIGQVHTAIIDNEVRYVKELYKKQFPSLTVPTIRRNKATKLMDVVLKLMDASGADETTNQSEQEDVSVSKRSTSSNSQNGMNKTPRPGRIGKAAAARDKQIEEKNQQQHQLNGDDTAEESEEDKEEDDDVPTIDVEASALANKRRTEGHKRPRGTVVVYTDGKQQIEYSDDDLRPQASSSPPDSTSKRVLSKLDLLQISMNQRQLSSQSSTSAVQEMMSISDEESDQDAEEEVAVAVEEKTPDAEEEVAVEEKTPDSEDEVAVVIGATETEAESVGDGMDPLFATFTHSKNKNKSKGRTPAKNKGQIPAPTATAAKASSKAPPRAAQVKAVAKITAKRLTAKEKAAL
eukprot:gene22273-28389_t